MKKKWASLLLLILIGANLFYSIHLYKENSGGFFAPHGDSVARAILSYGIATGWDLPSKSIFQYWKIEGIFPHKIWPPFQFYFNAVIYRISGDLLLTPFLSNCIFTTGILVCLYLLIRIIIPSNSIIALTGVFIYITFPGFKMIDLSGLDQTILNFFLIGGLYFWLRYRSCPEKRGFVYLAAIFFLVASSVRFEGWFCVAIFELFILGEFLSGLWMRYRHVILNSQRKPKVANLYRSSEPFELCPVKYYLLPVMLIPLIFIIIWVLHQQLAYGEFIFLNYKRNEAITGGDQLYLNRSFIFKLAYYPVLLFKLNPLLVSITIFSLLWIKKYNRIAREYLGFILIEFAILIYSMLYVGAPHGTARIIISNLLLLLPIAIAGPYYFLSGLFPKRSTLTITALLFFLISLFPLITNSHNLHNSISSEVSRIGATMRELVENGTIGKDGHILVEMTGNLALRISDTQRLSLFAPKHAVTFSLTNFSSGQMVTLLT